MKVRSAETEAAHSRAARVVGDPVDPRTRLAIHEEGAVLQDRVGLLHADHGRRDLVVQRLGHLEQAGESR